MNKLKVLDAYQFCLHLIFLSFPGGFQTHYLKRKLYVSLLGLMVYLHCSTKKGNSVWTQDTIVRGVNQLPHHPTPLNFNIPEPQLTHQEKERAQDTCSSKLAVCSSDDRFPDSVCCCILDKRCSSWRFYDDTTKTVAIKRSPLCQHLCCFILLGSIKHFVYHEMFNWLMDKPFIKIRNWTATIKRSS